MLPRVLLVLFAAPTAPLIEAPLDEGWTVGQGTYFSTNDYEDDAGIAAASVKLELRRDDAGYGGSDETVPFDRGFYSTLAMPNEGARWCFRISHINALAQSSPPSTERCFRTDLTRPTSPAYVDAGAIVSTGRVAIDMLPATDVPSGVRAYLLELGPTRAGELYSFPDPELQFPLVAYVGEGTWYGWVHVVDHAYNDNKLDFGSYLIPITVTANPAIDVPEAPRFEGTMVNAYGISLLWDAGWFAGSGVTHVVASFCNLDAGCEWRHASHTIPVGDSPGRWVQVEDEGTFVARIAVVKGGEVGPWSLPTAPVLVDRTPPPVPPGFNATPSASRAGPVSLSWGAVTDGLTGLSMTVIDEKELVSGVTRRHQAPAPAVSLTVWLAKGGLVGKGCVFAVFW